MDSLFQAFVDNAILLVQVAMILCVPALFWALVLDRRRRKRRRDPFHETIPIDEAALERAERELKAAGERDWIVLRRYHGPAYSHTAMLEIVSALAAEGIEATYEVITTSSADGGVTNYMLKVVPEDEERARETLDGLIRGIIKE